MWGESRLSPTVSCAIEIHCSLESGSARLVPSTGLLVADARGISVRACPFWRCFVLHTSGESVLLQVAQAAKDNAVIMAMKFFMADVNLSFQSIIVRYAAM
jgi:hypothetical protein